MRNQGLNPMFNAKNGIKILIVDDDRLVLSALKRMLEKKGYQVRTFEDPKTALEYLKTGHAHLIITDLQMPGMDGIRFLHQAKQIRKSVPVIFSTAFATTDTAVTAMQLGAFDFIKKPLEPDKIYGLIERALGITNQ